MQKRTKTWIAGISAVIVLLILLKIFGGNSAVAVRIETVDERDLVASVTASGKIQPNSKADISADISGRITRLAVKEGDSVTMGQFLLEIDPSQYRADVDRASAAVAASRAQVAQANASYRQARANYERVAQLRDRNPALVSEDQIEKLRTEMDVNRSMLEAAEYSVDQAEAGLRNARSAFSKATIVAPMSGKVTRLNIRLGETAIMGTLNRDAATLLTIADMSTLETKVKVDETEISRISIGDSAIIYIDAFRDSTFKGIVTEISNSSINAASLTTGAATGQAVDYEVTVQLLTVPPNTRPDFTTQARIITARRKQVLSIPIVALTVREHEALPNNDNPMSIGGNDTGRPSDDSRDVEGVFVVNENNVVSFRPVRVGVSGEDYFEVIGGLQRGERIVAGPYQAIRQLSDGMKVKELDRKSTQDNK